MFVVSSAVMSIGLGRVVGEGKHIPHYKSLNFPPHTANPALP